MKTFNGTLSRQLLFVTFIIFSIIFISLGILLPKALLPIYENNIYQYLKQPLSVIQSDFDDMDIDTDIAYLYVYNMNGETGVVVSNNLSELIGAPTEQILNKITKKNGKFKYSMQTYYYNTVKDNEITKIAITNDSYINGIKKDILYTIFPILFLTFFVVAGLLLLWSRQIIKKIEHLKTKVKNLDNDNYIDKYKFKIDDELKLLSDAIDDMKLTLQTEEEYKNQMYQNISHDFKTPLTVIKSYIEGIEDGIQPQEAGFKIIKEQLNKLELKVHSLLYLNKLNYLKDLDEYKSETVDVSRIIETSVEKFQAQRPDIIFKVHFEDKKVIFRGTEDMWEAIVDNLLSNFMRYADKEISITFKNNKITLYNDGPNVDPDILNDIFTPYKKGIKGQFGLGLSIVKKTVSLFKYEIYVRNEKKGVSFIIK